jgi:uncharacterized membrane protein YvbJ
MVKIRYCPSCEVILRDDATHCPSCGQHVDGNKFHASGTEAMAVQERIVIYHAKMATIRAVAAYSVSVIFVVISALLIGFAPESRSVAANIIAGALLILGAGIAGFTRLRAKAPGLDLNAGGRSRSN